MSNDTATGMKRVVPWIIYLIFFAVLNETVFMVFFGIDSLAGFAFRSFYPLVVAARAVQGIGASAIPALIFVIVARWFGEAERPQGKLLRYHLAGVRRCRGAGRRAVPAQLPRRPACHTP